MAPGGGGVETGLAVSEERFERYNITPGLVEVEAPWVAVSVDAYEGCFGGHGRRIRDHSRPASECEDSATLDSCERGSPGSLRPRGAAFRVVARPELSSCFLVDETWFGRHAHEQKQDRSMNL